MNLAMRTRVDSIGDPGLGQPAAAPEHPFDHYMRTKTLPDDWRKALEQTWQAGREQGRAETAAPAAPHPPAPAAPEPPADVPVCAKPKVGDWVWMRWPGRSRT